MVTVAHKEGLGIKKNLPKIFGRINEKLAGAHEYIQDLLTGNSKTGIVLCNTGRWKKWLEKKPQIRRLLCIQFDLL